MDKVKLFDDLMVHIFRSEGGFVNDPADAGGATNLGISWKVFVAWAERLGLQPTVESLKRLTKEQAKRIYEEDYWKKSGADRVNDKRLAHLIFDSFVNMGYGSLYLFQKTLGLAKSSSITSPYIDKLNSDPALVFAKLRLARENFYRTLVVNKPSQSKFLVGWLKRLNSI